MNHLYTLNSTNYIPISFKDRYFYDYYDIVHSFLGAKLASSETERLLRPMILTDGNIHWYGSQEGSYHRITEIEPLVANTIKQEFNSFIQKTQEIASSLKAKNDADNAQWGNLISELFQHERIILIGTEHGTWAILWGWDFLSNNENKLPFLEPTVKPITDPNPEVKSDVEVDNMEIKTGIIGVPPSGGFEVPIITDEPTPPPREEGPNNNSRMGCLGQIKRVLRWISYRFWGLFWLIIYTLLIIYLCRRCARPNCDPYCKELNKTKKELLDLERRVRERCDTAYLKSF
jgi:hypothetical protein